MGTWEQLNRRFIKSLIKWWKSIKVSVIKLDQTVLSFTRGNTVLKLGNLEWDYCFVLTEEFCI